MDVAEITFVRSVAGYIGEDRARSPKIMEGLNILNLNNIILEYRFHHNLRMEIRRIQTNKKCEHARQ
jgi:hypothetical protein